jgi:hypothetical protein
VAERQSALPPVFAVERAVSPEELHKLRDEKLLIMMSASASDVREIIRRTLIVIEQTRIILRGLDDLLW